MHGHRSNRPSFKAHVGLHQEILSNELKFGDGEPFLGKQFTAAKARERKPVVLDIVWRAAKSARNQGIPHLAARLEILGDKLYSCRANRRCGSLACEECRLAFQRAKFSGQVAFLAKLKAKHPEKQVVMANIIPLRFTYRLDQLDGLDVAAANRWLKDALTRAHFRRVMLGSFDLSWEDGGFYQGHWHIPMLTKDRNALTKRLRAIFPAGKLVKRPVVVSKTNSPGYLPYKDKGIKILHLLKTNRRGFPYLLLALDRIDPLELLVLFRVRLSAQFGELRFKKIS
jgi:hypothetical protein